MIKSAPFSFVRFEAPEDNGCSNDMGYTLPAFQKHEAAFQFLVDGDYDADRQIRLLNPDVAALLLSFKHVLDTDFENPSLYLVSITVGSQAKSYNQQVTQAQLLVILEEDFGINAEFRNVQLMWNADCKQYVQIVASPTEEDDPTTHDDIAYMWHTGFIEVPQDDIELPFAECFNYVVVDDTENVLGVTNPFKVALNDCYTSLLTYSAGNDAFGFLYPEGVFNRVRLPIFLSKPSWPKTREVYLKSNGENLLVSAQVGKEYQLDTDIMPEQWHECFTMALSHNSILIDNPNVKGTHKILETSNYAASWPDPPAVPIGPGTCRVKVAVFGFSNSNCGSDVDSNCGCDKTATINEITYDPETGLFTINWDLTPGTASRQGTTVEYSQDDGAIWLPAGWANLEAGTISAEAFDIDPDIDLVFRILPKCGGLEGGADSGEYTPVVVECIPVTIDGDPELPNGMIGEEYAYVINISGTAPYELSDIVKPDWMGIALVGSTIQFSGTPEEAGDNEPVSFTLANCEGAEANFADTVTVEEEGGEGILIEGRFAIEQAFVCGAAVLEYYTAEPFGIGVQVYPNSDLTGTVGTGYFVPPSGIVYVMTDSVIVSATGDTC